MRPFKPAPAQGALAAGPARLYELIQRLPRGFPFYPHELAGKLGISIRSYFKYLAVLRRAGLVPKLRHSVENLAEFRARA